MERNALARTSFRAAPLFIAITMTFGTSVARAQDSATVVDPHLMQFANVKIVNAANPTATGSPSTAAGLRAYKDSANSELRGPTPEEMQTAASDTAPVARVRAQSQSTMRQFTPVGGGTGMVLDDSFMLFSVVARQTDGTLAEACVTGVDQANAIVANPALIQSAPKEVSLVR